MRDPHAHYMHPVGFDRLGRPVIYSCLALAANRSVEDNRLHMIATFEQVGLFVLHLHVEPPVGYKHVLKFEHAVIQNCVRWHQYAVLRFLVKPISSACGMDRQLA